MTSPKNSLLWFHWDWSVSFNNWIQFLGWTSLGEDFLPIEAVSAARQPCSDCSLGHLHFLGKAVEALGGGWWMWAVYSKADITYWDLASWASSSINSQGWGPSERGYGVKFQFHYFEFLSGVLISLHWLCREIRRWGWLCQYWALGHYCPLKICHCLPEACWISQ